MRYGFCNHVSTIRKPRNVALNCKIAAGYIVDINVCNGDICPRTSKFRRRGQPHATRTANDKYRLALPIHGHPLKQSVSFLILASKAQCQMDWVNRAALTRARVK